MQYYIAKAWPSSGWSASIQTRMSCGLKQQNPKSHSAENLSALVFVACCWLLVARCSCCSCCCSCCCRSPRRR
eukprot:4957189-Amphidinium_carterae.1